LIAELFFFKLVCIHARVAIMLIHIPCTISGIDCVKKIIHNVLLLSAGRTQTPSDNSCKMWLESLCTHWWDGTLVMISHWLPAAFTTNQSELLYPSQLGMLCYLNPEKVDMIY